MPCCKYEAVTSDSIACGAEAKLWHVLSGTVANALKLLARLSDLGNIVSTMLWRGRLALDWIWFDRDPWSRRRSKTLCDSLPPSSKSKFKVEILQPDPSDLIG